MHEVVINIMCVGATESKVPASLKNKTEKKGNLERRTCL